MSSCWEVIDGVGVTGAHAPNLRCVFVQPYRCLWYFLGTLTGSAYNLSVFKV